MQLGKFWIHTTPISISSTTEELRSSSRVMSFQAYGCKERTKTPSCKSNKKTSEKFNNCINKQETISSNNCVGEYENVCEIEKKDVRSCIDKNELILGNLTC